MVGVQRDVDVVLLGDLTGVRREGDRPRDHVLDGRTREVLGATGRDLDDAVGAGLSESRERRVQRLAGRDVDGGEGESLRLAVASISAYFSGVAMGMQRTPSSLSRRRRATFEDPDRRSA